MNEFFRIDKEAGLRRCFFLTLVICNQFCSGFYPSALANSDQERPKSYRPASSRIEKRLDHILLESERIFDKKDFFPINKNDRKDKDVSYFLNHYITKELLEALDASERELVQQNCNGVYTGELCGFEYFPITCSQDVSSYPYQYLTKYESPTEALVSIGPNNNAPLYKLKKINGEWKIDGIDCSKGNPAYVKDRFNMKGE